MRTGGASAERLQAVPQQHISQQPNEKIKRTRLTGNDFPLSKQTSLRNLANSIKPSKHQQMSVEKALQNRRLSPRQTLRQNDQKAAVKGIGFSLVHNDGKRRSNDVGMLMNNTMASTMRINRKDRIFEEQRRSVNTSQNRPTGEDALDPEASFTVRRFSQTRTNLLPLGGLLGERVAKSIAIFNKARQENNASQNVARVSVNASTLMEETLPESTLGG